MSNIFDEEWFIEELKSARHYAWYMAKYYVTFAREFQGEGFRKFYVKEAMWHRAHAKQISIILNNNYIRLNKTK